MSARPLFYLNDCAEQLETIGDEFKIEGPEAQHIIGAKRLRIGDKIEVTNGRGLRLSAEIKQIGDRQKSLSIQAINAETVEPPTTQIILASAVAKGDRQSTLIDMACQLGISQFWPVQCDFSSVKYTVKGAQRWQRIVTEACKQSRRVWFPIVKPLRSFDEVMQQDDGAIKLLGHQTGHKISAYQESIQGSKTVVLLVGPEGGFSERELRLAEQQDVKRVSVGEHILRIETACSAIIAAVNQIKI
ncbi:MAG: 16S rRNA (uracil1498-N3)-methyltransferase [Saprospiraceae bacterium]|jgi:16S rRNA (uracil1498-N3)-methyltransferase